MSLPTDIRVIFYNNMGKILQEKALRIFDKDMVGMDEALAGRHEHIYTALSSERGGKCREFGILSVDSCISGAEMLYDAEYLVRNGESPPNHMASDLFGHVQGCAIFGPVLVRRS